MSSDQIDAFIEYTVFNEKLFSRSWTALFDTTDTGRPKQS